MLQIEREAWASKMVAIETLTLVPRSRPGITHATYVLDELGQQAKGCVMSKDA